MNKATRLLLLLCGFLFLGQGLSAQEANFEKIHVVQGDLWTRSYTGFLSQITNPLLPSLGELDDVYIGSGQYELRLWADSTALGKDEVLVYYQQGSIPNVEPQFLAIEFEIVRSIIHTEKDYVGAQVNEIDIPISPLINDSSTFGSLHLHAISMVNNGAAEIVSPDEIRFTPDFDFEGMAYVDYVVCDSAGTCANGQITVCVLPLDPEYLSDTVQYSTSENSVLTILSPGSGYQLEESPEHGSVSYTGTDAFDYMPVQDFVGQDTFTLYNEEENVTRTVVVRVLELPDINSFAVDDYVYLAVNDSIVFNVFENDLTDNFELSDFTDNVEGELTYLGDGSFSYKAPQDFEGLVQFDHTICDFFGTTCETAQVYIYMDNHAPSGDGEFVIVTPKNTPVILNYDVPILGFDFEINASPSQGWLGYYPGANYVYLDCHEVYGYNQLVYNPSEDYVGKDSFLVSYCINTIDSCQEIKINLIVLDLELDTTCPCVSNCVWPGDANGDGKVNVRDILPLGYNLGATGPSRPEADATEWYGQYCEDWSEEMSDGTNIKHIDTDGDGILLAKDTNKIKEYYYSVHTVIPEDDDEVKAYPIQLSMNDTVFNPGDWATIFISAGSDQYPMIDFTGLSFSIDFNSEFIIDSTLKCTFLSDSWLSHNSPILSLDAKPYSGRLEAAITRTDGLTSSGQGTFARLDFIVGEEDVTGFGPMELFKKSEVTIKDIQSMRGDGSTEMLPGGSIVFNVRSGQTRPNPDGSRPPTIDDSDLIVYPNPAREQCILHLNGDAAFHQFELVDQQGVVRYSSSIRERKRDRFLTEDIPNGMYFVRVHIENQILIKKLVIVHE